MQSLKTYQTVKNGDVEVLRKVKNFLSGYHLSIIQLKEKLAEYIKIGYFAEANGYIKITTLGIKELKFNS